MRKLLIPGLALLLVLGLSACDLNIFNSFEDIPIYSAAELDDSMQNIESDSDEGKVDEQKVMPAYDSTEGKPEDVPETNSAAKTLVTGLEETLENSSGDLIEDGWTEEEITRYADNAETVVSAVLNGLGINVETITETDTFESLVEANFNNPTPEKIAEARELVQSAANVAVNLRFQADPESRSLINNSVLLLLGMQSRGIENTSRSVYYPDDTEDNTYDNIPEQVKIALVKDSVDYFVTLGADDSISFNTSGTIIDIQEFLNGKAESQHLIDMLSFIDEVLAAEGNSFGFVDLRTSARLEALDNLLDDEGSNLLTQVNETFNLAKISQIARTFNSVSKNSRAFAASINYNSVGDPSSGIDMSSLSSNFKERNNSDGNEVLNNTGEDMVIKSAVSLIFEYLFDIDGYEADDDTRGALALEPFADFLNKDDMITLTKKNVGSDDEYTEVRIQYLADLIPELVDPNNSPIEPEDIKNQVLERANLVVLDSNGEISSLNTNFEKDLKRLDKLLILYGFDLAVFDENATSVVVIVNDMFGL